MANNVTNFFHSILLDAFPRDIKSLAILLIIHLKVGISSFSKQQYACPASHKEYTKQLLITLQLQHC